MNRVYSFDDLVHLVSSCLGQNGLSKASSQYTAKVIVAAEADGCLSHGLFRLSGYVSSLRSGKVNLNASPKIHHVSSSILRIDGDGGFAPHAHEIGRRHIVEVAKKEGVVVAAFVNTFHFSALWADIEPLCANDLCALAVTSYLPAIAPAGGIKPLFGTNPLAFGWPRTPAFPMIFDQASSVVAKGEVMLAAREGHTLAAGIGIDSEGRPTNDPQEILQGAMLPFGGYKGSAIALMVELLAGPMIGETLSFESAQRDNMDGGPPRGGELVIAFSPEMIGSVGWKSHAEKLFVEIKRQGARLPADRRYRIREQSMKNGISVSEAALIKIKELM